MMLQAKTIQESIKHQLLDAKSIGAILLMKARETPKAAIDKVKILYSYDPIAKYL